MSALTDDERSADELSAPLRVHLARCPSCRKLADRILYARGMLKSLAAQEPPESLLRRTRGRAVPVLTGLQPAGAESAPDRRGGRRSGWRSSVFFVRAGLGAAAAVMLTVSAYLWVSAHRHPVRSRVSNPSPLAPGSIHSVPLPPGMEGAERKGQGLAVLPILEDAAVSSTADAAESESPRLRRVSRGSVAPVSPKAKTKDAFPSTRSRDAIALPPSNPDGH